MKKLFVLPAIALATLISPQIVTANETITIVVQQEKFTDISKDELPQAVLIAVAGYYKKFNISSASVNEDKSLYKLELSKDDGESVVAFCKADGTWVDKKDD